MLITLRQSLLSLVVLLFFSSCSTQKIPFSTSTVVPAANGTVKVKKDRNNNYLIDVSITNLADPERLTPPRKVYLAWMETEDNGTKNIGQLNSSSGLFSKTLKASLTTVSTFKPTKIFITAEDDSKIESPGSQVVITTRSF
jgi:hypothetical protein